MARSIGAQLALLTFGLALLAGLYARNAPTTILTRALVAMLAAYALGQLIAAAIKRVIRDHLQRRKTGIDREHLEELRSIEQVGASTPGETSAS